MHAYLCCNVFWLLTGIFAICKIAFSVNNFVYHSVGHGGVQKCYRLQ